MDYYNAAMDPHTQMSGYAGRFIDVLTPSTGARSRAVVALFERCFLPGMCAHARVAVQHPLPYSKMHHFSQVGQDMWALQQFKGKRGGTTCCMQSLHKQT